MVWGEGVWEEVEVESLLTVVFSRKTSSDNARVFKIYIVGCCGGNGLFNMPGMSKDSSRR